MNFVEWSQGMQELFSPTSGTLISILLIVDACLLIAILVVLVADKLLKTVSGFVYRWKHRNDPPPKVGTFGIALGAMRGVCFGCPGLTNVRYCAICRLRQSEKEGEEK